MYIYYNNNTYYLMVISARSLCVPRAVISNVCISYYLFQNRGVTK